MPDKLVNYTAIITGIVIDLEVITIVIIMRQNAAATKSTKTVVNYIGIRGSRVTGGPRRHIIILYIIMVSM